MQVGVVLLKEIFYTFQKNMKVIWMYKHGYRFPIIIVTYMEMCFF